MKFDHFLNLIPLLKDASLGGLDAQFKLAPPSRKPYGENEIRTKNPKSAAVLALFYERNNETNFLLTLRANYNGTHASQISFPGGKSNSSDLNLQQTALREAEEEIGISIKKVKIIREMTQVYIPPSNFLVTPFIGYLNENPIFTQNYEVKKLIEISVKDFLNDTAITATTVKTLTATELEVPCFLLNNYVVWGATAMMLSEIRELLKSA